MLRAFDDGRLFGRVHGQLPARVLALHGWGRSSADFDRVLEGLDAVALDLPGFGASPAPPQAWASADYAAAIERALTEIGRPLVVLGHSFGGRVALALAAARPADVTGLVFTGVPFFRLQRSSPRRLYWLARWLNRHGLISDAAIEGMRRRSGSADYRAAAGVMRDVLVRAVNERYDDELAGLACPVRLVWGANDDAAPLEVARMAQSAIGDNATLEVLEGHGHFVAQSAPSELRQAIDELLANG